MRTIKETNDMQAVIHLMNGTSNLIWVRSNLIEVQFTLSKALERSIFKIVPFDILVFWLCKPYCATPIDSWIFLASKNPNSYFEIDFESKGFRLNAIILLMQLQREMGRK
jgi:hypothetical protein